MFLCIAENISCNIYIISSFFFYITIVSLLKLRIILCIIKNISLSCWGYFSVSLRIFLCWQMAWGKMWLGHSGPALSASSMGSSFSSFSFFSSFSSFSVYSFSFSSFFSFFSFFTFSFYSFSFVNFSSFFFFNLTPLCLILICSAVQNTNSFFCVLYTVGSTQHVWAIVNCVHISMG